MGYVSVLLSKNTPGSLGSFLESIFITSKLSSRFIIERNLQYCPQFYTGRVFKQWYFSFHVSCNLNIHQVRDFIGKINHRNLNVVDF